MKNNNRLMLKKIKGGVTAASGFQASGVYAGIKTEPQPDLGVLYSLVPCAAAGVFTRNRIKAACVNWNMSLLPSSDISAVFCNSGNANSCTGEQGEKDIRVILTEVSQILGISVESILNASTGIIGKRLPVTDILSSAGNSIKSMRAGGGSAFAKSIMTTDTVKKEYAVRVKVKDRHFTLGGCAKGSGMIHPDMATMLAFISTDADILRDDASSMLRESADRTFNNLTIDGDTSTNDMALFLANGESGVKIRTGKDKAIFRQALDAVCDVLCAKIAADGEGATKSILVKAQGGKTYSDCRKAVKAVANSNLVKTAMFGNDPNWGRILSAVGYSGADFKHGNLSISLCGMPVYAEMKPQPFPQKKMVRLMKRKSIEIDISLGFGTDNEASSRTCDLTYDYIKINAEYHT